MRLVYIVPVVLFMALAGTFGWQLASGKDPSELPSALIGAPVPEFSLPPLDPNGEGFSNADLAGEVALVNVFASWCLPCRAEHPLLIELDRRGVAPIYGINYKDKPEAGWNWIQELGDPYTRIGLDLDGRTGIDFGVYGVPETYVIDRDGIVRHRHVGPLSQRDVDKVILPLIERLRL